MSQLPTIADPEPHAEVVHRGDGGHGALVDRIERREAGRTRAEHVVEAGDGLHLADVDARR